MAERSVKSKTAKRASPATLLWTGLAIGLLLRLAYLAEIRRLPFFDFPIIDGAEYLAWASRILSGEILWREVPIHGPVYPYFLAAALGVSGRSMAFAILLQFLAGLATAVLVRRIGRRVFGEPTATLGAIISATYSTFLYFEGLVLAPAIVLLLNVAMLERLQAVPQRPKSWQILVPGVLLGLSVVTHPSALLLLPAIAAWLALSRRRAAPPATAKPRTLDRARIAPAALFVAGALAIIIPVVGRNAALGGGPVLQRNVGKNLYIGLGPTADGTANIAPGAQWERLRRQAWEAGARTAAEESAYFVRETIGYCLRNPVRTAGLLAKKALLFVTGIHVDASQDHRFYRTNCGILRLPLPSPSVIIPLALLGLIRFRRRAPLLIVYGASYVLSTLAFAFATRYAAPAHPVLILFASAGLVELARAARARTLPARDAALLVALLLVANLDAFGLRQRQLLHVPGFIAKILCDTGRFDEGLRAYEIAAREFPADPDIRNGWGTALDRQGRRDEARAQYEAAVAADPEIFEARFNLAAQAHEAREYAAAIEGYLAAIGSAPWRADARLNLGAVYAEIDSLDLAAGEFEAALALAPDFVEAKANLASIESRRGNPQRAAALYKQIVASTPSADLFVNLGLALAQSEDYLGAQDAFRSALRIAPAHRAALFQLGMNLAGFQRYEEAIESWEKMLEADPGNEVAVAAIGEARARIAAAESLRVQPGPASDSAGR